MCKDQNFQVFTLYCCMYLGCGKEYSSKFNLKRHVDHFHRKIKQVQCQVCSKYFRVQSNLNEHMYIHTKQKPYSCQLCGLQFRHKSSVLAHKRNSACSH